MTNTFQKKYSRTDWAQKQTGEVLSFAEMFLQTRAASVEQRELFSIALDGLRLQLDEVEKQMGAGTMRAFVHLPLLIYEGVKGEFQNAIPLSAACSLIFLGLDIFDDVADGDFREHWRGHKPSEMNLIAATLLCSVPQMIIAELDAPPATIAAMQKTLAAGLLEMSAGQQADLTGANRENISVEAVEKSVAGKGGAEVEMFARMAAQFAGASREQTDAYGKFAKNLGIAGQLASDCFEMFCDSDARDLKNGTRTLPLALHLERLTDEPRGEFLSLLNAARNEETARQAVRELLQKAGVLRRAAFIIEIYCQKARNSLDAAKPTDFARENLRTIIDSNSFFTNKKQEKL